MSDNNKKESARNWIKVQFAKYELHQKTVEFYFPHRKVVECRFPNRKVEGEDDKYEAKCEGHGKFDVIGPNDQGLLSITLHGFASVSKKGYIFLLTQQEANLIVHNPVGAEFDFSCFVAG